MVGSPQLLLEVQDVVNDSLLELLGGFGKQVEDVEDSSNHFKRAVLFEEGERDLLEKAGFGNLLDMF